jgi:hypothetical protein
VETTPTWIAVGVGLNLEEVLPLWDRLNWGMGSKVVEMNVWALPRNRDTPFLVWVESSYTHPY